MGTGGTDGLAEPLRLYEDLGDLSSAAMVRTSIGNAALIAGRVTEADELLHRAGAEHTRFGRKSSVLEAALVQSLARIQLSEPAAALALIVRSRRLSRLFGTEPRHGPRVHG